MEISDTNEEIEGDPDEYNFTEGEAARVKSVDSHTVGLNMTASTLFRILVFFLLVGNLPIVKG